MIVVLIKDLHGADGSAMASLPLELDVLPPPGARIIVDAKVHPPPAGDSATSSGSAVVVAVTFDASRKGERPRVLLSAAAHFSARPIDEIRQEYSGAGWSVSGP